MRRLLPVIAVLWLVTVMSAGCALPPLDKRSASTAFSDTADTRIGRAVSGEVAAHPGKSGIYPLVDARDAFAARVHLAEVAERSIDVQYFIWHRDRTGILLFKALLDAANRGVRVRLLLDDNNTPGMDSILAALDAHPNIEIRLFNPFVIRSPRWIGYLSDFSRLNRRMHNKAFVADNQVAIVGGRNVGDEYFGATNGVLFADLDLMTAGPVVNEVSQNFDRYWASASSYPLDLIVTRPPESKEQFQDEVLAVEDDPATMEYRQALLESPFVHQMMEHTLPVEWAQTRLLSDDPAKGLGQARDSALLPQKLMMEAIGQPKSEVDLVSPYFVPSEMGVSMFSKWARQGVKIRVLTNSLEATDVVPVHSGYAKRRKVLLESGITLYELKRSSEAGPRVRSGRMGSSSGSSLHAKTFSVDGEHVFVGSFNFDQRSARLNTEMGLVVESPTLAEKIHSGLSIRMPSTAYQVHLSDAGSLYWTEQTDGSTVRYDSEPGATLWQRLEVWFLSLLPIDSLL